MASSLPLVLVPGLQCSARLYAPQVIALWAFGPVTVADHRRDAEIGAVAARILENAPPRFALAGLSYGGYIAFELMRQAPERIAKLALLDTSARADAPEQTEGRHTFIAMAEKGQLAEITEMQIPRFLHRDHLERRGVEGDGARDGGRDRTGSLRAADQGDHVAAGFAADARPDPLPDAGAGG